MSSKINLLGNIHKIFRQDPYLNTIFESYGSRFDKTIFKINELEKEFFFDTMSMIGVAVMENQLDYKTQTTDLEGKRTEIEARWKTSGKCDLKLLKAIANSWRNGEVAILFTNAVIDISFISVVGIPRDVESLKKAIEEAKPAHLPIRFRFTYRVWGSLPPKTWGYYTQYTWKEVMEKEGI